MGKPVIKRFDLDITDPDSVVSKSFELDKVIKFVTGVLMSSNRDDMMYHRGEQKIEINKEEYFPENYESKLLMSGINISPNRRYFTFKEKVSTGSGNVKITYKDTENALAEFLPYRVSIYVEGELED